MQKIIVINGPNLNLLGSRDRRIYGGSTLEQLNRQISKRAKELGVAVRFFQSNHEGAIIDAIQGGRDSQGIIINPGGYAHTSVAIRDAIEAVAVPAVEVHISNISGREPFRHRSLIAPVCIGQITGLGVHGYILALDYLARREKK